MGTKKGRDTMRDMAQIERLVERVVREAFAYGSLRIPGANPMEALCIIGPTGALLAAVRGLRDGGAP